ncbi:aldehyde dehydrogenase (NADP(+)) [Saccharicrinis sp. FJH54]|uniref:aldehyde dehydrogenase (NADP(+)) n=1 Tax=Saccharicrinis sp. FJH54 TaxID=3344665 RepID=UPI0035D4CF2A
MQTLKDIINSKLEKATAAFPVYRALSGRQRADFLRSVSDEINNLGDKLVETVMQETFLPEGRVRGEMGRTTGQLNKFADLLDEGSWLEATIDVGDPKREPLPKPDLRKMMVPLGPVVVFGAGNFPLAFSVAGGDTASALAGGNPVVVKGHPAHHRTGELVAGAISTAVGKAGLPEGVFGFIQDASYESGQLLVQHPMTKAVGFTGSQKGGRALYNLAAQRDKPIPVFAEMGSVNPVVILKEALQHNYETIAAKLVASVNQNAGQFCTNPGLIITTRTDGFNAFIEQVSSQVKTASGAKMFSDSVLRNYRLNADKMFTHSEVKLIERGADEVDQDVVMPVLAMVRGSDFMAKPTLHEEVFGPFSLIVACDTDAQFSEVLQSLEGQLTATVHATEKELAQRKDVVDVLLQKCGRLLLNGVPTGVEVCAAMQHGGPYPASTDARFTSVGVSAVKRFVRPVSYQDFPDALLPDELKNGNPLNIMRVVNNVWTKDKI